MYGQEYGPEQGGFGYQDMAPSEHRPVLLNTFHSVATLGNFFRFIGARQVGAERTPAQVLSDIGAAELDNHAVSHQNGGGDEVSVTGLSGLLADDQHVLDTEVKAIKLDDFTTPDDNTDLDSTTTEHGLLKKLDNDATHYMDGQGAWTVPDSVITLSGAPAANDIARFTDGDTLEGRSYAELKADLDLEIGTDVLAQQAIGIADDNLLEVDDADAADDDYAKFTANGLEGRSFVEVLSDIGAAAVDHDASHITGGGDEIDGDKLDIDWDPSNSTPADTPAEASSVDNLTAHLYGIDQILAKLRTRTEVFYLTTPAVDNAYILFNLPWDVTVTEVYGVTDAGTCDINIEQRAKATPATPGTNVIDMDGGDTDLAAAVGGATADSDDWDDETIPADFWGVCTVSAGDAATELWLRVKYTIDL